MLNNVKSDGIVLYGRTISSKLLTTNRELSSDRNTRLKRPLPYSVRISVNKKTRIRIKETKSNYTERATSLCS